MATKAKNVIEITPIQVERARFTIVGTSSLICHAWSHKAKQEILDKQTKKSGGKAKHVRKNPVCDFMDCLYWLSDVPKCLSDSREDVTDEQAQHEWGAALEGGARFGFPISGIKQSVIMGAKRAGFDVVATELRGSFFLRGVGASTEEIAEIDWHGTPPAMREDMVMVGGMSKSADIRHRPEFMSWSITMDISYNRNGRYSLSEILNCINAGGFACGIGEWRPERDGQHGMYELAA